MLDGGSLPSNYKPRRSKSNVGKPRSSAPRRAPTPKAQAPRRRPRPPAPAPIRNAPAPPPQRSAGPIQPITKPKPKPPSISKFLAGDELFQQAIRGGNRTLQDFLSELNRRRGEAKTGFSQSQEQMEKDRVRQLDQMKQEFASRGLIHSGLFGQEQGKFQEDFQTQMQQLEQANTQLLSDILAQETNAKREQELAKELARQEALQRRAAKFNIGT